MNKLIPALLLVVVVALAYVVFSTGGVPTKDEALRFVQEDLASKYPGALQDIISAEKDGNNWNIKARVTFDAGTPCPTRLHAEYRYPEFGYVVREEWITRGEKLGDCSVCVGLTADKCLIFFEEEAVIASHTRIGSEEVSRYVLAHPDAVPTATFFGEDNGYAPILPSESEPIPQVYYNVWLVTWHSASDSSVLDVLLTKEQGRIVKVWTPA
ncbi:Uncharacterised protein [Candidatus Burarchaeum australiense]|nr:Uncharacterised protein [Candidatus Burarchaeum australiense]